MTASGDAPREYGGGDHFPRPDALEGPTVRLTPLREDHRAALRHAAGRDEGIWQFFPLTFNGAGDAFDDWFDHTLAQDLARAQYPFAVIARRGGAMLGTTRFYDMSRVHRRLAIGSTWYVPEARGSRVNAEVRLLTLAHAFEGWRANRVELITDPRNLASRAAMKLLGAVQEGVMRRHLIYRDGRVRDSVLYSIIADEWPAVRARLAAQTAETASGSVRTST